MATKTTYATSIIKRETVKAWDNYLTYYFGKEDSQRRYNRYLVWRELRDEASNSFAGVDLTEDDIPF